MPTKKKGGRPPKEFDKKGFEGLCKLQCTKPEICSFFECDEKTLTAWCKRTYKDENGNGRGFSDIYKELSAGGKISLRRAQFEKAVKRLDRGMLIWLGKQYLGQKDTPDEIEEINEKLDEVIKAMKASAEATLKDNE